MNLTAAALTLFPVASGKDLSWEEIQNNFSGLPVLEMGQSWLPDKDPALREGLVRAGMARGTEGEELAVYAEMIDEDIFNASRSLNERTWTTGDVFEMFIKSESVDDYYEFHVTPENQKLQLHFPSVAAFRARLPWGTHCLDGERFFSRTQVEAGRWKVYAEVPLRLFQGSPWRFSFCRYDATRGRELPVLSSTSAYTMKNFHRIEEWGRMERAKG